MISQNELRVGLSDDELDELELFLDSRCVPHDGMTLSMLDGYLTAVVSGPEFLVPSAWLPYIWEPEEKNDDTGFVFASIDEAKRIHALIIRRMNEISHDLERGEINPIFLFIGGSKNESADGASPEIEVVEMWCIGYYQGICLRPKSWDPLKHETEEKAALLDPITSLAARWVHLASGEQIKDLDAYLSDGRRTILAQLVPQSAYDIYRYWRERRALPTGTIRSSPRPGRNELCSCGSTKKYKKCCG